MLSLTKAGIYLHRTLCSKMLNALAIAYYSVAMSTQAAGSYH